MRMPRANIFEGEIVNTEKKFCKKAFAREHIIMAVLFSFVPIQALFLFVFFCNVGNSSDL